MGDYEIKNPLHDKIIEKNEDMHTNVRKRIDSRIKTKVFSLM